MGPLVVHKRWTFGDNARLWVFTQHLMVNGHIYDAYYPIYMIAQCIRLQHEPDSVTSDEGHYLFFIYCNILYAMLYRNITIIVLEIRVAIILLGSFVI